jgi:hypothetical protein
MHWSVISLFDHLLHSLDCNRGSVQYFLLVHQRIKSIDSIIKHHHDNTTKAVSNITTKTLQEQYQSSARKHHKSSIKYHQDNTTEAVISITMTTLQKQYQVSPRKYCKCSIKYHHDNTTEAVISITTTTKHKQYQVSP